MNGGIDMTYEKMTGEINLEELEVQAEEVKEASGFSKYSNLMRIVNKDFFWLPLCF